MHGWRDRIRLGPVDGEPFMDVVLPWSDVLAVGGRTDTLGVFFAEAQSLPDGWYDLAVTLNLDGRGDGGTLRFQVRSNAVVEWTFPYELITR